LQLRINVTNVKIVVFIELNDKDAYCAHENAKDAKNVENIDAFMNMSQLKVTQIWDMRLNEYSKYWSLKALKSVTIILYKLRMNFSSLMNSLKFTNSFSSANSSSSTIVVLKTRSLVTHESTWQMIKVKKRRVDHFFCVSSDSDETSLEQS